jgi:hypothetical protein
LCLLLRGLIGRISGELRADIAAAFPRSANLHKFAARAIPSNQQKSSKTLRASRLLSGWLKDLAFKNIAYIRGFETKLDGTGKLLVYFPYVSCAYNSENNASSSKCAPKHILHIRHFGNVPIVERLVEGPCVPKHLSHILHFGHVPIVEGLVKRGCAIKHTIHIRHVRNVTLRQ